MVSSLTRHACPVRMYLGAISQTSRIFSGFRTNEASPYRSLIAWPRRRGRDAGAGAGPETAGPWVDRPEPAWTFGCQVQRAGRRQLAGIATTARRRLFGEMARPAFPPAARQRRQDRAVPR